MNMLTRQGHLIEEQGFIQRLAALVPRPRLHLLRFHGVLAPNAKVRAALVPGTAENPSERACEHTQRPARMSWARLLKRVFDRDVKHCPNCGGAPKIIAAIGEPAVISRILTHLGLPARAPARPGAAAGLIQAGVILATTTVLPPKPAPRLGLRLRVPPQRP